MRPCRLLLLLLLSLLVSDLSPLGDGDRVMENYSWSLYGKLPHNGQMTPRGLEILQTQNEHHCMFIQRNCVYVAVQDKHRTSPFYWVYTVHDDRGGSLSHREFTGLIHKSHVGALVVFLLHAAGVSVPVFLMKSDSLAALLVISQITLTKAGGESSRIATEIRRDHPDSRSAWLLHHHTAASGHNLQAFSLEKSKNWAPATNVHEQKMLTKKCCVVISCSFKEGEIRSALNIKKISKQQMKRPQKTTQKERGIKVLTKSDGQWPSTALVHQNTFQAAALHSGTSSMKASDISLLEIQRNAVRIIKTDEHLNLDKESLLHRQPSLKASSVYDDDGFYAKRQRSLVPREKTESINRLKYKTRAAQDGNKEDFSGKIITKQAEFRRPEGGSETEQSRTNTIENGNQRRLAYIRQADFTHKADNNDVDRKQMLTEVGEEVLIMLFLPDRARETQTEPLSLRKPGWKTVNIPIKELDDPPPLTKVMKENFIMEADKSKCKRLKGGRFLLELYARGRTQRTDIKPAESAAKVLEMSAYSEEKVKETVEKIEHAPHGNMSINQTKQEDNVPSEESVIPSPPSLKMMETETTKTHHIAETTTANMEIKETTSSAEVFNQASTRKAEGLPSTAETPKSTTSPASKTDTEPRFIRSESNRNIQAATESFSGLRMREDIPSDSTRPHEGSGNDERAATNRPGNEGREDQYDPEVSSFTFAKPSQTIYKEATDTSLKTTDANTTLCGGLIHRTDAGWKHCVERFAGTRSEMIPSQEPTDAEQREQTSIRENKDSVLEDAEYDHFYYFDGVLKRVGNQFYPHGKRRRWRKRSHDGAHEKLLSYIKRLALRNDTSRFR